MCSSDLGDDLQLFKIINRFDINYLVIVCCLRYTADFTWILGCVSVEIRNEVAVMNTQPPVTLSLELLI